MEKYEAGETVEAMITGENRGGLVANVMGINGFIPASQIATYFVKNFKQYIGQTLECKFLSVDERKRRVVLSARAVLEEQLDSVWDKIVVGETIKGKVVRMTDFGAFVDLGGVDGLIHVSDISWQRIEKPSDILEIGQEVEPIVLKANRERNRISLGLKQLMPKPFEVFKEKNKPGDVVKGTVVNLLDFGAFVRLDEGVEGLIHVSQIAHHHVEKPSDEFNIGQELEVKILEIDEERQRIALSTRALEEPPVAEKQEGTEEAEGEAAPRHIDTSKFERHEQPKAKQQQSAREETQTATIGQIVAATVVEQGETAETVGNAAEETTAVESEIANVETEVASTIENATDTTAATEESAATNYGTAENADDIAEENQTKNIEEQTTVNATANSAENHIDVENNVSRQPAQKTKQRQRRNDKRKNNVKTTEEPQPTVESALADSGIQLGVGEIREIAQIVNKYKATITVNNHINKLLKDSTKAGEVLKIVKPFMKKQAK